MFLVRFLVGVFLCFHGTVSHFALAERPTKSSAPQGIFDTNGTLVASRRVANRLWAAEFMNSTTMPGPLTALVPDARLAGFKSRHEGELWHTLVISVAELVRCMLSQPDVRTEEQRCAATMGPGVRILARAAGARRPVQPGEHRGHGDGYQPPQRGVAVERRHRRRAAHPPPRCAVASAIQEANNPLVQSPRCRPLRAQERVTPTGTSPAVRSWGRDREGIVCGTGRTPKVPQAPPPPQRMGPHSFKSNSVDRQPCQCAPISGALSLMSRSMGQSPRRESLRDRAGAPPSRPPPVRRVPPHD